MTGALGRVKRGSGTRSISRARVWTDMFAHFIMEQWFMAILVINRSWEYHGLNVKCRQRNVAGDCRGSQSEVAEDRDRKWLTLESRLFVDVRFGGCDRAEDFDDRVRR